MERECKIAMKSKEFVRRGLPQLKGSGPSETFRRRQGIALHAPIFDDSISLSWAKEDMGVKVLLKVLETLGKM
ncbi:UNVERIFIED_CONTAM: hypothetical protein Sradi_3852800 [Sesamum radiatum]|uniref:Uncharacterized protein n=1 Tax=Sesamum radiatum TaxID=300843 RepID=A0AAW2Q1S4_SESRA